MVKQFKKYSCIFIVVLLLLFVGFYRDFVFKSINGLLKAWDHDLGYYLHSSLAFLENLEYDTLVNLKWFLTLLFTLIYLAIAIFAVKIFFSQKKFILITCAVYIGITAVSALLMISGIILSNSPKMYEFARYLMGIAQSPVILMILIPVFKLAEKEKNNTIQ
jgi:hypothetical protein